MNIFVTSECPFACAKYLDDKRVVKMVLETAQILSTAVRVAGFEGEGVYKITHINHPCSKWVRESRENYMWTLCHFKALCQEYTARYGKVHKSEGLLPALRDLGKLIPAGKRTDFVNCAANQSLGVDYKNVSDVFLAYRLYLKDRWSKDKRAPSWTRPKNVA